MYPWPFCHFYPIQLFSALLPMTLIKIEKILRCKILSKPPNPKKTQPQPQKLLPFQIIPFPSILFHSTQHSPLPPSLSHLPFQDLQQDQYRYQMESEHYHNLQEEIQWKLNIITDSTFEQHITFANQHKYQRLFNLLHGIPDEVFIQYAKRDRTKVRKVDQLRQGKESTQPEPGKLTEEQTLFENWGETVKNTYEQIYYPTSVPAFQGQQVPQLQQFVRDNVKEGKRIRGAGIRHSWGHIFSDPNQYLASFYPYDVAVGYSWELEVYAQNMTKLEETLSADGIEHLCSIRKVGEVEVKQDEDKPIGKFVTKHLIKVGAGVSNQQMRKWCIKNGYQYKSNVIMVEVNVVGAIGTCSHGAGIGTQTLSDYVYEIEFIDHNGNRQKINKKDHPHLIRSAASCLGLLGLIVFVTLQMDELDIVEFVPRNTYKDLVIPWPRDYANAEARRNRPEYLEWVQENNPTQADLSWQQNLKKFKEGVNQTYSQWFYFPVEGVSIFQNNWRVFAKKTPLNILRIKKENPNGNFQEIYPSPLTKFLSEFSLFVGNFFINNQWTQSTVNIFMRAPFIFFPKEDIYLNYPDAVHFQRGIQNMKVRDFEVEINIPTIITKIGKELDYDFIQRIWWAALEFVEPKKDEINIALEMRIFKGSKATLAPEIGYEYVCSIEILRSLTFGKIDENKWRQNILDLFNIWRGMSDSKGNPILIRPHWGKEWDFYPEVKAHVFNDVPLKAHINKFLTDYQEIANVCGFDKSKNLSTFSNQLYRELLNTANNSDPIV